MIYAKRKSAYNYVVEKEGVGKRARGERGLQNLNPKGLNGPLKTSSTSAIHSHD